MERYSTIERKYVADKKANRFLRAILRVCKRHGFMLSHEDGQGGFQIIPKKHWKEWTTVDGKEEDTVGFYSKWLLGAHISDE